MFILKNAILVSLCVCVFLVIAIGCMKEFPLHGIQEQSKYENWYKRHQWKAEDYFDDPKVISLCKAMESEDLETIDKLIVEGVNVNATGKKGMQPILWAYPAGEKVFEKILEAGGDPNFEGTDPDNYGAKRGCGFYGSSLLYTAVSDYSYEPDHTNYLALLLRYGADPEAKNGRAIFPSLGISLKIGQSDGVIQQFIEAGINLNITQGNNSYPVTNAATNYRFKALMLLLETGAEYHTDTQAGMRLQNILYKHKTQPLPSIRWENFQEDFDKCIAWLEERGVSFDKPAEKPEVFREVEEFRVNDKLLKWREVNAKRKNAD